MKAWHFIILMAVLLFAGCSETSTVTKKTDWETQKLEGKVKQIEEIQYFKFQRVGDSVVLIPDSMRVISVTRFNEGGRIAEIDYYNNREVQRTQISKYDDKGNRHEVHSVNRDGSLREKSHYEFDAKGNIVKRTNFRPDTLYSVRNYTIDANGNTTEEIEYNSNGNLRHRIITPYDENSNRTEYIYELDGRKISWMKYRYNEQGKMLEMTTLDSIGGIMYRSSYKHNEEDRAVEISVFSAKSGESRYLDKFNEKDQLIERQSKPTDGSPGTKTIYKYNEKGTVLESIEYTSDNSIKNHRKFDYVYDSKGNWTRRINSVNDSIILPIYVREIQYFE